MRSFEDEDLAVFAFKCRNAEADNRVAQQLCAKTIKKKVL